MTPMHIFRVYFVPAARPHPGADFELVALPVADATEVLRSLNRGIVVRGTRLMTTRSAADPKARLINGLRPILLQAIDVQSVRDCDLICSFRPGLLGLPEEVTE